MALSADMCSAGELSLFDRQGRTAERHRAQIRTFLDFRERTVADAEWLTHWLATQVCERERRADRQSIGSATGKIGYRRLRDQAAVK